MPGKKAPVQTMKSPVTDTTKKKTATMPKTPPMDHDMHDMKDMEEMKPMPTHAYSRNLPMSRNGSGVRKGIRYRH